MLLQVAHDERALRHDGFAAGGDIRHGLPDEFGSEPAAREGRIDLGVGKDEAALLVGDEFGEAGESSVDADLVSSLGVVAHDLGGHIRVGHQLSFRCFLPT